MRVEDKAPPAALLELGGLAGGYGDTLILRPLSARLQPGEVLGVLGRNGVGKTTLMRLLTGSGRCFGGTLRFRGCDIAGLPPHARQRLGISYAPQEGVVFDALSVRENLTLHHGSRSLARYEALFEQFPRVRERLRQPAGVLSGGEKKLVSFCRALAEQAPLTLLDEPTEGVQHENIERMAAIVAQRAAAGAGFIVVEQNLGFLLAVMSAGIVLDHGELVLAGRAAELDRPRLEAALQL
jgi:ABC-type branched-subunit amino acid transport system ATPase component